jgi:hypothetical protein
VVRLIVIAALCAVAVDVAWFLFFSRYNRRKGALVLRWVEAACATRGRVLDHIGVDVKDHVAFVKKIEAEGIKLDEPPRMGGTNKITYITDPWGTRIEIIERGPLGTPVN